jgi:hypothetical protein
MTITVAANNARIRYTATSSQTAFAIPFEFFENDEIYVYVAATALVSAAERGQGTGSTEYGISGGGGSTGAIAFVTGITQGHIVTIVRDIPIERITDFTAGTTINRAALNTQLDTLTAMVGDLKDKSDRAIRLHPYDSEITLFLPTIDNRAGKIFGFDANGNLTTDTAANFDITLDDIVMNTLTMSSNANSKVNLIAATDSQIVANGAVLNLKSTKSSNTSTITLDGSTTYGIDFNAGNKAIRMQDATLFSSTAEVTGALTAPLIVSQSGGTITLQPTGNQVFIKGTGGESRITFHNPAAPSMEFTGDSSLIGSGSFLLDITDEIILDSASGSLLLKDAGTLRMTFGFNGTAQSITSANELTIASSANGINIKPATSSTDFLATNGAQTIGVISSVGTAHLKWYQNSNTTLLKVVDPTATRTLLLPNESGTIHSSGGATTHANITVSTDGKVQFRDSAIYIQSGADGHLDLVADTEIHIAATTVNVDGLMDVSGNLTVGGTLNVTGSMDFGETDITNVGSISLDRVASDTSAGINLDSSGPIIIDSGNGQAFFKHNGSTRLTFAHQSSGLQTLTSAGIFTLTATTDINLRPNGGQLYVLSNSGGDNFQFNTGSSPTLGIHQNSNVTNIGLVNPTATRTILFPDASDTLVGKATTDTLTNKTLTAPTLTGTAVVASLDISGDIDVDGTTNLDMVDIDGAVNMATTALVTGVLTTTAATVFNGGFAANDGSTISTADNTTQLALISTDDDAAFGPVLELYRNSASPANWDPLGKMIFQGEDSASNKTDYAHIAAYSQAVASGSEIGYLEFKTYTGDTGLSRIDISGSETVFNEGSADLDFRVESNNNANAIFVDGGNDRVGVGTNAPTELLEVFSETASTAIEVSAGKASTTTGEAKLVLRSLHSASGTTYARSEIASLGTAGGDADLIFRTTSDSNGPQERLRITDAGNVGVNTASPDAIFTVDSNGGASSTSTLARFHSSKGESDSTYLQIAATRHGTASVQRVQLQAFDDDGSTGRTLSLNGSGGNVGIGTHVPTTTLTVKAPSNAEAIHVIGRSDDIGQILFLEADASTYLARIDARNSTFNIQAMPNIPMTLGVNSSATVTLETNGDATIEDGNLVIGTSGHGIDFSATGDGAGTDTSELLDDYEEGTWVPTLPSGGTVGTVHRAIYTKIGNRVTVNLYFNFTATNNTSGFYIGGLPYGVSSNHYGGGNVGYLPGIDTGPWSAPLQTSSHIYFYNANATNNLVTNNVFGGVQRSIILEVFYQTG